LALSFFSSESFVFDPRTLRRLRKVATATLSHTRDGRRRTEGGGRGEGSAFWEKGGAVLAPSKVGGGVVSTPAGCEGKDMKAM